MAMDVFFLGKFSRHKKKIQHNKLPRIFVKKMHQRARFQGKCFFNLPYWQECSLGGTPPSSLVKLWVMPRTPSFSKKEIKFSLLFI
jgi:hypothetical protein